MAKDSQKQVVFIQNAEPPLKDGSYLLDATQTVPNQTPGSFTAKTTFIVQGERFTIKPEEIDSVFPPNLANGEFDGVLPHVVFDRNTLPWERSPDTPNSPRTYPEAPWLAILVCDDAMAPPQQSVAAKDLVPLGTPITVIESTITGTGTLVATTLSYGAALLQVLGYGETPEDACTVIDLPIALWNQIAPAAADLEYLAHLREVDTSDGVDAEDAAEQHAIVVANRIPAANGVARAFLVSLEGMADYLPAPDGTQSAAIGSSINKVRVLCYRSWSFITNDMDQTLEKLLTGLNTPPPGGARITTLTLPIAGAAPSAAQVTQAMANQASGRLSSGDATVLMQNALLMGYVPLNHHLRHGGQTVSFYRGPLAPYAVPAKTPAYYSGPDAANAYDPQTGLFDVSYGAAWQLGQLLALQSSGMSNHLYQWKRSVTLQQALAAEQALFETRLQGASIFPSFLARRRDALAADPPPLPDDVLAWFGNLARLDGVPFNYLVPDPRMLPPESIRFFTLDANWVDALIDGAFSIGRAAATGNRLEARHGPAVRRAARVHGGRGRRAAMRRLSGPADPTTPITGFIIRSQAVSGWPNLRIVGYSDAAAKVPLDPPYVVKLSNDTTLCLFTGVVASLYLREPPEQQHHGVEGTPGSYFTTLRSVSGGPGAVAIGEQYEESPVKRVTPCDPAGTNPWTCIPMRGDGRTVQVAAAADAIHSRLAGDFAQSFPQGFTSAEFALELTKGVVEVEFRQ